MLKNLDHLTTEPGCEHNTKKSDKDRKAACTKPTPGATAGGCAFDGAQIVLMPIADAAHLIHGPITCCGHSYNNRGTRSIHGNLFTSGFTTDLSEMDIVMGGEEKLKKAILHIATNIEPKAIFVYQTCVPAMLGEDIEKVCRELVCQVDMPLIPVYSPGFIGNKNIGNKLAGDALIKYVIGTAEPEVIPQYGINLIGEYNIAGELWQIEPIFDELGIKIQSRITGNASFDEIRFAHRSKLSLIICSRALISLGRMLQDEYYIPYLEGSFYGMKQIRSTLMGMAELFQSPMLSLKIDAYTKIKESNTLEKMKPYLPVLKGKKVLVYTGGVKSWSVLYQLEELGMEVIKSSTRKSTDEDIEKMLDLFNGDETALMPKGDGKTILKIMKDREADLLLAGGRNMYTAVKGKIPFVDVNQERLNAYAGYEGMVELAKHLYSTLTSPVFNVAHSQAPWEAEYE